MVRIGFIIDTIASDTAGTQKQLIGIIRRLNKQIFKPSIICLWESQWMRENDLPCEVHILGYRGFLKPEFASTVKRFVMLMNRKQFDIIQTFFMDSIFVGFLGALLCNYEPVLLSSRRDIGLGLGTPWYHNLYRIALPFVNLKFDGIIANSDEVKKYVTSHEIVRPGKVKVIRNGVSITNHTGKNTPARSDDGLLVIGLVGNLQPVKRLDIFLQALSIVRETHPDLKFCAVICGDGPEAQNLLRLAEELQLGSAVNFAGMVQDVSSYLEKFDIGVVCSDREGLSNAILEYMAHALPVVATAVGGNVELVDERNGFCVEPRESKRFSPSFEPALHRPGIAQAVGRGVVYKAEELVLMGKVNERFGKLLSGIGKRTTQQIRAVGFGMIR